MPRNCNPIDESEIPKKDRLLAFAIHEAFEAKTSFPIVVPDPNGQGLLVDDGILDGIVNLHITCGSDGIVEYMLQRDGGPNNFVQLPVVKGQVIEGNFKRFGSNTTVYPLVAFANG